MNFRQFVLSVSFALASAVCIAQPQASPPAAPLDIRIDEVDAGKDWILPEGHYVRAKMPMHLVHPRPDTETNAWARHRKAYPGLEYRIPIAVQGGAYPFYFEIIEAPEGMSIGQTVWDNDYGVLSWTPSDSLNGEAFPVRIRVYGQEHGREVPSTVGPTMVEANFVVRVTDSTEDFIFVDENVETSGDASIGAPLKTLIEVLGDGDSKIVTYPGRAVYLRNGTYDTLTDDWHKNKGYAHANNTRTPVVFLGYPDEAAAISFTNGTIYAATGGDDLYFGGLTLRDSSQRARGFHGESDFTPVGSRMVHYGGHRTTLFENHWINTRPQFLDYSQIFSFERVSDTVFKVRGADATDAYRRNVSGAGFTHDGLNRNNDIRVIGGDGTVLNVRVYDVSYDGVDTHVQIYSHNQGAPVLPGSVVNVKRMYKAGNEGFVYSGRTRTNRPYFTFLGNRVDDWNTPGNTSTQAGGVGSFYMNKYMVFEGNVFGYGQGWEAINLKISNDFVSIRRNEIVAGKPVYAFINQYGGESAPDEPEYLSRTEIAYNKVGHADNYSSLDILRSAANTSSDQNPYRVWVYRNTLIGKINSYTHYPSILAFEKNLIFTSRPSPYGLQTNRMIDDDVLQPFSSANVYLDGQMELKDAWRDKYLGTHGHVIRK